MDLMLIQMDSGTTLDNDKLKVLMIVEHVKMKSTITLFQRTDYKFLVLLLMEYVNKMISKNTTD